MVFILFHRNAASKYRQYVNRFMASTIHCHIGPHEPTLLRERLIIENPNKIYNSKLQFTLVNYSKLNFNIVLFCKVRSSVVKYLSLL